MDGGVECVPVMVKIELNNKEKAFDLLVDLCSPTGHKLRIVLERMRLQMQAIKLDSSTGMVTPLSPKEAFSDCIPKPVWVKGNIWEKKKVVLCS